MRHTIRVGAPDARRPARERCGPRCVRRGLPSWRAGRRHLGRMGRRREDAALGTRHHHQRLVDDQDHDLPGCADAARPRATGLRGPCRQLLARIRGQRQRGDSGSPRHGAHRGPERMGGTPRRRGLGRLEQVHCVARRAGTVVGTGYRLGLPRAHPGVPHRRDRSAHHRRLNRDLLRARGGQAARGRLPYRLARQ